MESLPSLPQSAVSVSLPFPLLQRVAFAQMEDHVLTELLKAKGNRRWWPVEDKGQLGKWLSLLTEIQVSDKQRSVFKGLPISVSHIGDSKRSTPNGVGTKQIPRPG